MPRKGPQFIGPAHARVIAERGGVGSRHALNLLSGLVQRGEARRLAKGVYAPATVTRRRTLAPTAAMRRIARTLAAELPALEPVISSTGQVASLMHNTPTREVVLVAISRPYAREVARVLAANGLQTQVVSTRVDMERLADLRGRVIVAVIPVGELRASEPFAGVRMARPERILVDLAIERDRIGLPVYAEDIRAIGESLLADYDFSVSRALDYARRRRAYDQTARLLRNIVEHDERLRPYAVALP